MNITEIKRKICLIGDWEVGKTSLIRRYVLDQFSDQYFTTIGVKVLKKRVNYKKENNRIIDLTMSIWDIMGQKDFIRTQNVAFYGTGGGIIVCDVTRRSTLESLGEWQNKLIDASPEIPVMILANKMDLMDQAEFNEEDLKTTAVEMKASYFFTSAKTGENVETAFRELGEQMCKKFLN